MTVRSIVKKELVLSNILYTIETAAADSIKMFNRSLWLRGDKVVDLVEEGSKACALFVSSVLVMYNDPNHDRFFCRARHATVDGLIKDLRTCGWFEIEPSAMTVGAPWRDRYLLGTIVVWEKKRGNRHMGFYVGGDRAVSMCPLHRRPEKHQWDREFDNHQQRAVDFVLRHPLLVD